MAKNRNKTKGLTKDQKIFIVLFTITLLTIGFVLGAILFNKSEEVKNVCYDIKTFNETLWDIQENCGGTFLTHKYGSNDWSIFANKCNSEGFCKSDYIKLEDCLG